MNVTINATHNIVIDQQINVKTWLNLNQNVMSGKFIMAIVTMKLKKYVIMRIVMLIINV